MIVSRHQLAQHRALRRTQTRFRSVAQGFGHPPPLTLGRSHPILHCVERQPKPSRQYCRRALTMFIGHQHPLTQIRRIGKWHESLHQPLDPAEKDGGRPTSFRHTEQKTALISWIGMIMFDFSVNTTRTARRVKFDVDAILSRRLGFAVLLAVVAAYYLFLLSNGSFQLFAPELLDKAFGNMLVHLLHGEFTVDRDAIGFEAFTRDGKTYAYFGIFPAVLRLLAMPFTDVEQVHLARLSCLAAVVIFVALQLRMLLIVHHSLPAPNRRSDFLAVMVAATVLSGPQLYILGAASIYHEPILWSAAMAAGFNLIVVRAGFDGGKLRTCDLVLLATFAGLTLNTRVPIGVSLYLGTMLLVAWTARREYIADASNRVARLTWTIVPPIVILGLAVIVAGIINLGRWGNPLTFADFRYYDMRINVYTNLVQVLHTYGEFNVGRIWIGALYYATGIPYLLKNIPPFAEFLHARVIDIEAPPITPILTNPLTIILAGIGLYRVCWKPELTTRCVAILRLGLLGHAATVLLILAAMAFTLRYRFDFAPFMTLAAFIGYSSISVTAVNSGKVGRKWARSLPVVICVLGILSSHYVLLVHKVWSFWVPMNVRLALFPFAPFARHAFEH